MHERTHSVHEFLAREATLLDERKWDEWLELFAPDVEYWVPAWENEVEHTQDPDSELSLIYYAGRFGLEDRVFRIRSGLSSASTPPARTCHLVSGILCDFQADGSCVVTANWSAHVYRFKETHTFYGRYRYELQPRGASWVIRKKQVLLLNDAVKTAIDIYCL